jgi:hypothetical protein
VLVGCIISGVVVGGAGVGAVGCGKCPPDVLTIRVPNQCARQLGVCDQASCAAATGACVNGVCTLVRDLDGIDPFTRSLLDQGGAADPNFAWFSPDDGHAFALDSGPPTLDWYGKGADAVRVHIGSPSLDYTEYFAGWPHNPSTRTLDPDVWAAIVIASGIGTSEVDVSLTKVSDGVATGPIQETWTVASPTWCLSQGQGTVAECKNLGCPSSAGSFSLAGCSEDRADVLCAYNGYGPEYGSSTDDFTTVDVSNCGLQADRESCTESACYDVGSGLFGCLVQTRCPPI